MAFNWRINESQTVRARYFSQGVIKANQIKLAYVTVLVKGERSVQIVMKREVEHFKSLSKNNILFYTLNT